MCFLSKVLSLKTDRFERQGNVRSSNPRIVETYKSDNLDKRHLHRDAPAILLMNYYFTSMLPLLLVTLNPFLGGPWPGVGRVQRFRIRQRLSMNLIRIASLQPFLASQGGCN